MKRTIILTTSLATVVALSALGANAQQQVEQANLSERMSIAQIATLLEDQGYTVLEIELERGRFDVEMIDSNGMRVEAYLNPVTAEVLPYGDDDDDDRRDGDRN